MRADALRRLPPVSFVGRVARSATHPHGRRTVGLPHVLGDLTVPQVDRSVRVLGDGEPKMGAHGKPVLFLHPKDFDGTLIELEQV